MRNQLSPTCLSPRSWSVKFSKGTRGKAFVLMCAVCTAVGHCLTFKIPFWMHFWLNLLEAHTRRAMCLLRQQKCMLFAKALPSCFTKLLYQAALPSSTYYFTKLVNRDRATLLSHIAVPSAVWFAHSSKSRDTKHNTSSGERLWSGVCWKGKFWFGGATIWNGEVFDQ